MGSCVPSLNSFAILSSAISFRVFSFPPFFFFFSFQKHVPRGVGSALSCSFPFVVAPAFGGAFVRSFVCFVFLVHRKGEGKAEEAAEKKKRMKWPARSFISILQQLSGTK
jgi:hypothetical protein